MKLNLNDFITTLKIAEPALASRNLVEELNSFWFTGDYAYAYSDLIGIALPFVTEFKGGIRGNLLSGSLDKFHTKDVTVTVSESSNELLLKAGNAKTNLALLENDRAIWEIPVFDDTYAFDITPAFLKMIDNVLVSIGQDTSIPDQAGVTLELVDNQLHFYTSDSRTMSWGFMEKPEGYTVQYCVLPEKFCEQLLKICKKDSQMVLTENSALALTKTGIYLFSRLIDVPRPRDYQTQIQNHVKPLETFAQIPIRMGLSIDRVIVLFEGKPGEPVELSVVDDWLWIKAENALGEVEDVMKLEGHANCTLHLDPALVKKVLPDQTLMLATDDCLMVSGVENIIHFVSPCEER